MNKKRKRKSRCIGMLTCIFRKPVVYDICVDLQFVPWAGVVSDIYLFLFAVEVLMTKLTKK